MSVVKRVKAWLVICSSLLLASSVVADEPHGAGTKKIYSVTFEDHGETKTKNFDLAKKEDLQTIVHKLEAGEVEELTSEKQPNLLALQWELGVWTLVIFLLLCTILSKVAWRPTLEGLRRREHSILSAIEDAKRARSEADALRQQFQKEMAQAQERVSGMIEEGRRNAQRAAEEETAKARAAIQEERERLHRDLQRAKDQALQELWSQTAQLATVISSKAIQRQLNVDDHRRLVDEALTELNQRGAEWKQKQFASA